MQKKEYSSRPERSRSNRDRFRKRYNRRPRGGQGRREQFSQSISRERYISTPNPDIHEINDNKAPYLGVNYSDLNLEQKLFNNLTSKGYETTTEIQEKTIPLVLEGKNVLGISETGSGKTAAFLIPLINRLLRDSSQRVLITAPTRELATQIAKEAISLLKGTGIFTSVVIGGENMSRQISQLRRGDKFIIGTPGRLNDLIKRKIIKSETVNNLVIDEVDKMLEMGFVEDVKKIFASTSTNKQTLFFSATHNQKVETIVKNLINSYETVKLSQNSPKKSVAQSVIDYSHPEEKMDLLHKILNDELVQKAIIFVETKRYADKVYNTLNKSKFRVNVIHGDKRQGYRTRVIEMFTRSKINLLVATNVAARGIDVNDVTHVINLDEPGTYDDYIHRIGRTGRNGRVGTAYTFVRRR